MFSWLYTVSQGLLTWQKSGHNGGNNLIRKLLLYWKLMKSRSHLICTLIEMNIVIIMVYSPVHSLEARAADSQAVEW